MIISYISHLRYDIHFNITCWQQTTGVALTGSAGIKYASAPQGTAVVIAGVTTFDGTKTEAAAPYVVGVDSDEYFTTFESGAWPGAPGRC